MTTTQPKGFSGLDAHQIVVQSCWCHPDWDTRTHIAYLVYEEGINLEHLRPGPGEAGPLETIARWIRDCPPCPK
jgi:hypothetical protein